MIDFLDTNLSLNIPQGERKHSKAKQFLSLTEDADFFKRVNHLKNSDIIHRKCCQFMQFTDFPAGSNVLDFGQPNDKLIFILDGGISVFSSEKVKAYMKLRLENINFAVKASQRKPQFPSVGRSPSNLKSIVAPANNVKERAEFIINKTAQEEIASIQGLYRKEINDEACLIEDLGLEANCKIKHLANQRCFGQVSMLVSSKNIFKVVAQENVRAVILTAKDFIAAIEEVAKKEFKDKIHTLKQFNIFENWTKLVLYKVSELFSIRTYQRGQILFREEEPSSYIYFVVQGEFLISKSVVQETKGIIDKGDSPLLKLGKARTIDKKSNSEVCTKGVFQIIGLEECFNGQDKRTYSCECRHSDGKVFCIKREDFVEKVMSRLESFDLLKESLVKFKEAPNIVPVALPKGKMSEIDRLRYFVAQSPRKHTQEVKKRTTSYFSQEKTFIEDPRIPNVPVTTLNRKYFMRKPAKKPKSRSGVPPNFLKGIRKGNECLYNKLKVFEDLIKEFY